jgi:allophanate hydrolase
MDRPSVIAIAAEVAAGRHSAADMAAAALARAADYARIQPQAWIARVPEAEVMAQARRVDARRAAGDSLPLAGVPFAVKDNIDVAGLPTTAACPAYAYEPRESATVVRRLQDAGALLLGKTNLDQFATGLVGTRSPYGIPACVYNRDYVSGGSSAGSAVLVGAGVVAFALGTDTAGSGRVPAAFNGLTGLKPSRGRWSTRGVVPACRSLDCVSVFTADAADAAAVDAALAAFDAADPYSRASPGDAPSWPAAVRVGVARPGQLSWFGDAESPRLFEAALARLRAAGATPVEVDIAPLLAVAQLLYAGPWVAERLAAIEPLMRSNPGAVHPVVRGIIQGGYGVTGADVFRGQYALQEHLRASAALWERIDVLALPTTPTIYRIRELLSEPVALNSNLGHYTNFVNLLDMSAISVPAGFRANGTGFGASLIGPAWADRALLDLARRYEAAAPMPAAPPLDLDTETTGRSQPIALVVVGAHLAGMPLHWQLSSRGARLVGATHTAPHYRLYAIAGQVPPKPALVHVGPGGHAISVEVYELAAAEFGTFVAEVPAPLAIGTVTLADGSAVAGFVAEPRALEGARDISALGGWRAFIEQGDKP